jgi:hypothetical protein
VSHPTYRHLDTPIPYMGLTWRQWLLVVCCAALAIGVIDLLHPPTPVALWLATVLICGPATVLYFTTSASTPLATQVADLARWLVGPRQLPAPAEAAMPAKASAGARALILAGRRKQASGGDLLGLQALTEEGIGVLNSGALVRWLEVSPVNPLVHTDEQAQALTEGFQCVLARLGDQRHSLQLLAHARPLPVEEIASHERRVTKAVAAGARAEGRGELAGALERLGLAGEQSLRTQSHAVDAMELSYLVACPWTPPQRKLRRRGLLALAPEEVDRAVRESDRHTQGIASDLQALGLQTQRPTGPQVTQLLRESLTPTAGLTTTPGDLQLPGSLADLDTPDEAAAHTRELHRVLCPEPVDLSDRRLLGVGGELVQTRYLGSLPEQTWLGWLLYLMQAPVPWTLSVHVHGTDRVRERLAQRRRFKRIYGNNRGSELRGRPLDPDQAAQEQENSELNSELTQTSAGIYRLSVYLTLREPHGDPEVLEELFDGIDRETTVANEAHLHPGAGAQRQLFTSTLPVGWDAAGRTRKYVARNAADTTPLLGTGCGSPQGIPIGFSPVGRTLERMDLFDPEHPNHILVVVGESGSGKTTLVNRLYVHGIARGGQGAIIERGGHYDFLVSLIPGARTIRLGSGTDAICPWDTPNPAHVGPERIAYLIALHATLIGTGKHDEYGLSALEQSLLGRGIRQVYERCALTGERPRELLLQETLTSWATQENQTGSNQIRDLLRDLATRLENYVGEGPYAYLADKPTTIPAGAPLVVFDTRFIPDQHLAAAMLQIVEYVGDRVEETQNRHLYQETSPAGDDVFLLAVEEVWHLVEREATGKWVNEQPRRSRHQRMALIGVTQGFSELQGTWGRALLDNASQTVTFRLSPTQTASLQKERDLTGEEIQAIRQLRTVKREYATGFWVNGTRGRSAVTVRLGDLEYWIASHEPVSDEPLRRRALRHAAGDPWRALRLLADPEWHQQQEGDR